jgi:hypothetical protein
MKKHICLLLILLVSFQVFSQKRFKKSDYQKMIEQHPLGSISDRYTLVLTGYFDDCGEFGGHEETIELIRIDKKLNAIVTIYDKSCQDTNYEKPKILKTDTYSVEESKVQYFIEYLNKLLSKSLEYDAPFHAGRIYMANLDFKKNEDEQDEDYSFRRLKILYYDGGSNWTEFQKLKSIVEK